MRETGAGDSEGVKNEGRLFHCLSHVVLVAEANSLEPGDIDTRIADETHIDGLLDDSGASRFPDGIVGLAIEKLEKFHIVVFPALLGYPNSNRRGHAATTFGMTKHPDAQHVMCVRKKYEEILPFFRNVMRSGLSPDAET